MNQKLTLAFLFFLGLWGQLSAQNCPDFEIYATHVSGNPNPANTICTGETAVLYGPVVTGGAYIWSNSATTQAISVSQAGDYALTITYTGGCTQVDSIAVSIVAASSMICTDTVDILLDNDCYVAVQGNMLLEGDHFCDYVVTITGPNGMPAYGNIVTGGQAGQYLNAKVTHVLSGNFCNSIVHVLDQQKPAIQATAFDISCMQTNWSPAFLADSLGLPAIPVVTDNCGGMVITNFTDAQTISVCDTTNGITGTIIRTWIATDQSGNSTTATQIITRRSIALSGIHPPGPRTYACGTILNTLPVANGLPFLRFVYPKKPVDYPLWPDSTQFNISTDFIDTDSVLCDGSRQIARSWRVLDTCSVITGLPPLVNPRVVSQVITQTDQKGPVLPCPANITVAIPISNCCAGTNLPDIVVLDSCSRINGATVQITTYNMAGVQLDIFNMNATLGPVPGNASPLDTSVVYSNTPCMPLGNQKVEYTVTDDCGNSSKCTFFIRVVDNIPPVASCKDAFNVFLSPGVDSLLPAAALNNLSSDFCSPIYFKARKLSAVSGCPADLSKVDDTVRLCCQDAANGETQIKLVVYDVNPGAGPVSDTAFAQHQTSCIGKVKVKDPILPSCFAPSDITVECESFDPTLNAYGAVTYSDNCAGFTLTTTNDWSQFDTMCSKGTVTRNWKVTDKVGNTSFCDQKVVSNYEQNYWIKFPADKLLTSCETPPNYGMPEFYGNECESMNITYTDVIFTVIPDACFKIERTWRVLNWCSFNPNLPVNDTLNIVVPNPNPIASVNHPMNLPGVTLSPFGTIVAGWEPTVVKVLPTDPQPTNYAVFWKKNANSYTYTQVIKIFDTTDPVVSCPTAPLNICPNVTNNPAYWNAPYYYNAGSGTNDLDEGSSDVSLNAKDMCSGKDVLFRYNLFLDLDGNGSVETVVKSVDPPAPGTIQYNNINIPNYLGGQTWQFDFRPVGVDQKWTFGVEIDTTVSSDTQKARVIWKNAQTPQETMLPQLPLGAHRIQWYVVDRCGNETTCTYNFFVADCIPPEITCSGPKNLSFSSNFAALNVFAWSLIDSVSDNFTPASDIEYAVRKHGFPDGQGNLYGIPRRLNGTFQNGVQFSCAELGEHLLDVWAVDGSGNGDSCTVLVNIEDKAGWCTGVSVPTEDIAGSTVLQDNSLLEDAYVTLVDSSGLVPQVLVAYSDPGGFYIFENAYPARINGRLTPIQNLDPLNGVNTWDLVLISRHILNMTPLDSPVKLIAADANKSGTITSFDIVQLRKLILGTLLELPGNTSWRFYDKTQVFADPTYPFAEPLRESLLIGDITTSLQSVDFRALKVGDVDFTATANNFVGSSDRSQGILGIHVKDRKVSAGNKVMVHFEPEQGTEAYQFTMNLKHLEVLRIIPGAGATEDNFAVFPDAITCALENGAAFSIEFDVKSGGLLSDMLQISNRITPSLAFRSNEQYDIVLRFFDGSLIKENVPSFEIYQNAPNPWNNNTTIGFYLPEPSEEVTLTVTDALGKIVLVQKSAFGKGKNTFNINSTALPLSGLLTYTISASGYRATKRMIRAE